MIPRSRRPNRTIDRLFLEEWDCSKVEIYPLFASESYTEAKSLTEASTITVFQLTGYDTLTHTYVLARIPGSWVLG